MVITGTFYDINNNQCLVNIVKDDGTHNTVTIGENGLFFAGDPIRIETEIKDTTESIIRRSCSINLVTSDYMGDALWSDNVQTTKVTVTRGTECLFAGYVEPNSFSQPFARGLDEFTINCVDTLSVLQYANYNNTTVSTYDTNKSNAGVVTFIDIIDNIIAGATMSRYYNIYYDCSKGLTSGNEASIFSDLSIAENYLYGESYDDIWTQEDVLSEILQYLNMHILQNGDKFYIFDWATLQNGRNTWVELRTNTTVTLTAPEMVTLTSSMHGADDTNINITDVYSQVTVKCDLENIETVITSPLDDDSLTSPYKGKQLYMREYISEGNGTTAKNAFRDMLRENGTIITYDKAKYIDWYIRVMNNPKWIFHTNNGTGNIIETLTNSTETFNNGKYINQWKLPHTMHWNRLWPAILRMGSVERDAKTLDNSPTAKVSMSDYLYIPIGGNGQDDDTYSVPTATELQSHAPIIEYMGGNGGVYSPSDDDTTNYLVFTGKILLQPLTEETKTTGDATGFTTLKNASSVSGVYLSTVPSDNDEHGRYYTRKFFTTVNPSDDPDETTWLDDMSLQPWTKDKSNHLFQYNYSEHKYQENQDLVSKLPILECELIIGNKRLIETNIDQWGNSTFVWVTIGQEPTWHDDENNVDVTLTTFTLGVNPKIGDYIIGTEFDIQNTVSIPMNIEVEGTAIPIRKSDNLRGALQFKILGPVNSTWNDITRRHPTWFRHTKWTDNDKIILSHLESIIIKDLECKIYSDNAQSEGLENNELIYLSDETDRLVNKMEKTFKIITQPSAQDITEKGLKGGVNLNAVLDTSTGTPIGQIYNAISEETANAEEHYINAYYTEYSRPRVEMTCTLHNDRDINWRNTYESGVLDREFYVTSISEDVKMNNVEITLKEI